MWEFIRHVAIVGALLSVVALATGAPTVDVSYSPRCVHRNEINPDILESCIIATVKSETPIQAIDPPEELYSVDEQTWQYQIPWNQSTPLEYEFADPSGETTSARLWPQPPQLFNPATHTVPVINLRTDPANLWDPDSGIYVFGNHENCRQHGVAWERPAQFELYHGSLSPQVIEEIGLRINGGWTRGYRSKGLRFYFDDYGSTNNIKYDFFDSGPKSFQRLLVRPGSSFNCLFNSAIIENIFMRRGNLGSRIQPVVIYLNEEYWGLQVLRERLDTEFVECTHDFAIDDYILVKDGHVIHGDGGQWWHLFDLFEEGHNFSSHDWFVEARSLVDLDSYIDWLILNIFGATSDNGSMWNLASLKVGTEPWQFVMWDEDGIFTWDNISFDYFRFFSAATEEDLLAWRPTYVWSFSPYTRLMLGSMFHGFMQNSEFRTLFAKKYRELMDGPLSTDGFAQGIDEYADKMRSEIQRHAQRYNWPTPYAYDERLEGLKTWPALRSRYMEPQFADFMELYRAPVELSRFTLHTASQSMQLMWRTESEENNLGFSLYRGASRDDYQLIAHWETDPELIGGGTTSEPRDYSYYDEGNTGAITQYYRLSWNHNDGTETILEWVVSEPEIVVPSVVINEFMADNEISCQDESGEFDDWTELYNNGIDPVDLTGMYLTDDLAEPTKWELPSAIIEPNEYLVIWCDNDEGGGRWHTNFKLDADGEEIGLFSSTANGNVLIDSYTYEFAEEDVSIGRVVDGGAEWVHLRTPTPGASNERLVDPTLQIYQDPDQTEIMHINISSSKQIAPDGVTLFVGGESIPVHESVETGGTWVGQYYFESNQVDSIISCVTSLSGWSACDTVAYSYTAISSDHQGVAFSPDGRMKLVIDPQDGYSEQYVLILSRQDGENTDFASAISTYEICPTNMLPESFALEFTYATEELGGKSPACLFVESIEAGRLDSYYDPQNNTVIAQAKPGLVSLMLGMTATGTMVDRSYLKVSSNYPNPGRAETTICFEVQYPQHVICEIYDVNGRRVSRLTDKLFYPGAHELLWDGRSDRGDPQATGVYFSRIQTPHKKDMRRVLIIR